MAARSRPLAALLQDLSKCLAAESDDSAGTSQSAERETMVERMRSVLTAVLKRCTQPGVILVYTLHRGCLPLLSFVVDVPKSVYW